MIKNIFSNTKLLIFILIILLVATFGVAGYFYKKANSDPSKEAAKELDATIKAVSRHMILPENEKPTLATVSDPEKLKDQAFFQKAKKGDRVLVFPASKKAILYSPSSDRIIEVAPVNITGTGN